MRGPPILAAAAAGALLLAAPALLAPGATDAPARPAPGPEPLAPVLDCDPACNVRVTQALGPANEVMIAANPLDALHLVAVAKDYALGPLLPCPTHNVWMGVYVSHDGGRSWQEALMPGHPADPQGPLAAFHCSSDPVVAFGPGGSVHVVGLGYRVAETGLILPIGVWAARSDDGGAAWEPSIVTLGSESVLPLAFPDKPWLSTDPQSGAVHAAWGTGNRITYARSADGVAWGPPVGYLALQFPLPFQNGLGVQPAQGPGLTSFLAWARGTTAIGVGASADDGLTYPLAVTNVFAQGLEFDPGYRVPFLPAFAADPASGNLYLAWARVQGGASDIVVARSLDGGASFQAPVRVSDDPPAAPGNAHQFFPALALGPGGAVHVAWYDMRHGPAVLDVYYAVSHDAGATWSANLRVSTQSFDPLLSHHQDGSPFIGDYIGLAVGSDGVAHPAWADTRTGRADVFTARILP